MAKQYPDDFVAGIEWMWGEGFLSPGGPDEVRALLEGVDLAGCRVLDVGSGLGAVDVLLVAEHRAQEVIGIEVEAQLVARAGQAVARAGLSDRIRFQEVSPGPFPFADQAFDVVFSKDSMIHIPNKPALYAEVLRVLRPGGTFVASDWLYGGGAEVSEAMKARRCARPDSRTSWCATAIAGISAKSRTRSTALAAPTSSGRSRRLGGRRWRTGSRVRPSRNRSSRRASSGRVI